MTAVCIVRVQQYESGQPLIALTTNATTDVPDAARTRHLRSVDDTVAAIQSFLRELTPPAAVVGESSRLTSGWNEVERTIEHLEELLNSLDDDAQLANVDPLAALQHQQHCLSLLSAINQFLGDTTQALIRKIDG